MRNATPNRYRSLAVDSRGAEIAEAAAVLPLMFMMLLGIFWFGQAFSIYGAITRAAQEGARAGSAPYCVTCNSPNTPAQNAANAVQAALIGSRLDPDPSKKSAARTHPLLVPRCLRQYTSDSLYSGR